MEVSEIGGTPNWMLYEANNPIKMDDVGVRVSLFQETSIYLYVYIYICMYIYIYMYIHIHIHIHIHIYINTYVYIYIYTVYIHINMYIYIYSEPPVGPINSSATGRDGAFTLCLPSWKTIADRTRTAASLGGQCGCINDI